MKKYRDEEQTSHCQRLGERDERGYKRATEGSWGDDTVLYLYRGVDA